MDNNKDRKKSRDPFIAVAHHVKSPIYILKGYLDVLFAGDLGELNDKQKEYIEICRENVERANYIIETLLKVVEIEEGKYKVEKEEVDVIRTVEEVIAKNIFLARASNTKLSFVTNEAKLFVFADVEKTKKVFDSLIVNAMKYKKAGEGRVEIKVEKKGKEALCVVEDDGIGVSEKEKEKIFNKFYRTEKAMEIDPSSLGTELYIDKITVESCGGKMWVENNKKGGATFCFTLPLV
jgi:signal transduction histidine kinase